MTTKSTVSTDDLEELPLQELTEYQKKKKQRKTGFKVKGINGQIFRISKSGHIKYTKKQQEIIKQAVLDSMIQRLTVDESVIMISGKLGLYDIETKEGGVLISANTVDHYRRLIRKQHAQMYQYYMHDKDAYISEYFARIEEIKRITKERWTLYQENKDKPHLRRILLNDLRDDTVALSNFYDVLPVIVSRPADAYKVVNNEIHEKEGKKNKPGDYGGFNFSREVDMIAARKYKDGYIPEEDKDNLLFNKKIDKEEKLEDSEENNVSKNNSRKRNNSKKITLSTNKIMRRKYTHEETKEEWFNLDEGKRKYLSESKKSIF